MGGIVINVISHGIRFGIKLKTTFNELIISQYGQPE